MAYEVRDLVYDNRWVTFPDGCVIKFVRSLAFVPDHHIADFTVEGYAIGVQTHIDAPTDPDPVGALKSEKKQKPKKDV